MVSCPWASLPGRMLRNFNNRNSFPPFPTRTCRKKAPPCEVIATANANVIRTGDNSTRATREKTISNSRFTEGKWENVEIREYGDVGLGCQVRHICTLGHLHIPSQPITSATASFTTAITVSTCASVRS